MTDRAEHASDSGDLQSLLMLEEREAGLYRSVTPDTNFGGEVFGGQYLGLTVSAAMRSAPGRTPHALHGFFLRAASAADQVDYVVEPTRDGRAFAHRRVSAVQHGREAFRAEVSFHAWEEGQPTHAAVAPPVPVLEDLPSLREIVLAGAASLDPVTVRRVLNRRSFDAYFVKPAEGLGAKGAEPGIAGWIRPNPPPREDDSVAYYATLAYLSDACANFASRITHSTNLHDGSLTSVSLNHAIWFHALPCRIERVLMVFDSPFTGGGLGFNRGVIYAADGRVLASIVQEALVRRASQASPADTSKTGGQAPSAPSR